MGLLDHIKNYNELANKSKSIIKEVYLDDLRPWVIGYSGGKDSSTVLQLVVESLLEMRNDHVPLNKTVYVISSDTMVETPLIISSIGNNLNKVDEFSRRNQLPIETHLVRPALDNTFWVNLIGKGYPVPNQSFRWCTDRMKIEPTNVFIKEKVSEHGEVIVLLGVREGESTSRDRVIKSHTIEGKHIMKHTTLANAFTFAPIREFSVDDVWNYLLNNACPWGNDNNDLFNLYSDSNANECPLIIDKETKEKTGSCGNSRFGCWVCTVVNEDKALTGFVENGEEWLRPLLNYRNWLRNHRDDRTMRMKMRANGTVYTLKIQQKIINDQTYVIIPKKSGRERVELLLKDNQLLSSNNEEYYLVEEDHLKEFIRINNIDLTQGIIPNIIIRDHEGEFNLLGLGPYTFEARQEMIKKLLTVQKLINEEGHDVTLITNDELREIRRQWINRGFIDDILPRIYAEIYEKDLNWEENDIQLMSIGQYQKLEQLCKKENLYLNPLIELLEFEKEKSYSKYKKSNNSKIQEILTKDYLHY